MRSVDGAFVGHLEVLMAVAKAAVASLGRAGASRECIGFVEVETSRFYSLCQCRLTSGKAVLSEPRIALGLSQPARDNYGKMLLSFLSHH